MEKSCWEPSTTTAVSWGSPPLSQPSPPVGEAGDRLGHPKMWKPGWGSQGGRRGAGSKSSSRGGHGDILRARGRREAPICLPCWLSWMRAVLLVHKTAPQHHDVCGMQDPGKAELCPGSSISSRCSAAHLKLSVAPVTCLKHRIYSSFAARTCKFTAHSGVPASNSKKPQVSLCCDDSGGFAEAGKSGVRLSRFVPSDRPG